METIALYTGWTIIILVMCVIGFIFIGALALVFLKFVYGPTRTLNANKIYVQKMTDQEFEVWIQKLRDLKKRLDNEPKMS